MISKYFPNRHFTRKYLLPPNYKQDTVSSTLSSDGILTISAVNPAIQGQTDDLRNVRITSVGPQKEGVKADESSSKPTIEQVNWNFDEWWFYFI